MRWKRASRDAPQLLAAGRSAAKASTAVERAPPRMISRVTGWIDSGDDAEQIADHEIAFRHPRPFVEQPRGLVERLDVDLDDLAPSAVQRCERRRIGRRRPRSPKNTRWPASGTPSRSCRQCRRARRAAARAKTDRRRRRPPSTRERRQRVVDGEREHRDAVERAAGRHDAGGRDQAEARLEADDVVELAGTRPEPAVSVPSASGTRPAATATAEPELEPPGMSSASNGLRGMP